MPQPMTREEREAFLAEPHVGVISVAAGDDRAPLATPLWYRYEPGGVVEFMTSPQSRKGQAMQVAGRATLLAQKEGDDGTPPRYVSVEGPIEVGAKPSDEWRRAVHHHYLGPEQGDLVFEATKEALEDEVVYRLVPQRWNSSDFTQDFG